MGLLERSKVTLTVACETDTCTPDTTITGTLQVEVHELVSFTALRVRLCGKEKFYVQRRSGKYTYFDRREFIHVEQTQTLLGAPVGTKSSGATQLEPGTYSYPFSLYIPPQAPPSFKRCLHKYGCTLAYAVKGILDIPYGFDAKIEHPITVTQAVSVAQLQPARQNLKVLPSSEACIAKCHFCWSCFCCVDRESHLLTEAVLAPEILVMHSNLRLPVGSAVPEKSEESASSDGGQACVRPLPVSDDPSAATLRIRVSNYTKDKTPDRCLVTLAQRHIFPRDAGVAYHDTFPFAVLDVRFPAGPLYFGETTVVEVPFRVDGTCPDLPSGERLVPCLGVKHFCTITELKVTFPGISAEGTMDVANAVLLADDVDMSNRSVTMPHEYNTLQRVAGDEIPAE